jgi:hypothetical protein
MPILAFGRKILDPQHSTYGEAVLVLREMPRRFKRCRVDIVMRGASADYEDWIAILVSAEDVILEGACVDWLTKQVTRRGFALVPKA